MAPLSYDEKFLIRSLRLEKGWSATRLLCEFPGRNWKKSTVCDLIKQVLLDCWDQLSQNTINRAIDQLPKRLAMVIGAQGGHVEFHLN